MKNLSRAFTLIELLVVIAIIAILAAILFPVFAQAKNSAKKAVDLSNIKQLGVSMQMYAGDNEDTLPEYNWPEAYQGFAKMMPYVKNRDIFHTPASSYTQGSLQRKQHDNGNEYMLPPDDACVGLPPSTYISGAPAEALVGAASVSTPNYYKDIYPATDYYTNPTLQGYVDMTVADPTGACATQGKWKYTHPAASLTNGGYSTTQGVGPVAMGYTTASKVVYITTFPHLGTEWPGSPTNGFWGNNFKGFYQDGSNFGFLDSHAKYFKSATSNPDGTEDTGPACTNALCGWTNGNPQAGKSWQWWGTNFGAASVQ